MIGGLIGLSSQRMEELKQSRPALPDKTRPADSAEPNVWVARAKPTDYGIYKASLNTLIYFVDKRILS